MKRKYVYLIIFIFLFIGIGYAYLNTDLNMENNVSLNSLKRYTVTYGKEYGDLPTPPEREGYTFKGWNGKNMFDEESILMAISGATHDNEYYIFNPYNAHQIYGNGINSIILDDNSSYTLSTSGYTDYIESVKVYQTSIMGFRYEGGTYSQLKLSSGQEINKTITSTSTKKISYINLSYGRGQGNAHLKYIQLEEGNMATEYEPYYVKSDTKVIQNKNHTLTAIWKEN